MTTAAHNTHTHPTKQYAFKHALHPQLMALLEKEGPDFSNKMLVTVVGESLV